MNQLQLYQLSNQHQLRIGTNPRIVPEMHQLLNRSELAPALEPTPAMDNSSIFSESDTPSNYLTDSLPNIFHVRSCPYKT
jgi:hypothetical protein